MPTTRKKAPAKKTSTKTSATKRSAAKKTAAKPKYSPEASESVATELDEMNHGKLRSGSGAKVTNRKQAIAIGLSKARRAGAKVPKKT